MQHSRGLFTSISWAWVQREVVANAGQGNVEVVSQRMGEAVVDSHLDEGVSDTSRLSHPLIIMEHMRGHPIRRSSKARFDTFAAGFRHV